MKRALLFDLDETPVVEEPVAAAALAATAQLAAARHGISAPPNRGNLVEISTLSDLSSALGD